MSEIYKLMGLPMLASEHGHRVDELILYVHALMVVLFIGWFGYFLYALWRFNNKRNPVADHVGVKSNVSAWLEVAVAIVEAVLLLGFAIPLWAKVVDQDSMPSEKDSTVIRVTAQQFAWNARYPGKDGKFGRQSTDLATADNKFGVDAADPAAKDDVVPGLNDIAVPVNRPVLIHLTSMDVIHSFKLYPMRVNQDAIPGMSIPVHFTPNKVGKYQIVCAQLCGNSHYAMKGFFTVMTQADFDKWMAEKSKTGAAASFE